MQKKQKFISFLESMKSHNPALIEAVKAGFKACFENNDSISKMKIYTSDPMLVSKLNSEEAKQAIVSGSIGEFFNTIPDCAYRLDLGGDISYEIETIQEVLPRNSYDYDAISDAVEHVISENTVAECEGFILYTTDNFKLDVINYLSDNVVEEMEPRPDGRTGYVDMAGLLKSRRSTPMGY